MAMLNPYQQYAQSQVTTSSPEELTLMLYKGAVKFINLGIKALEQKNIEETNKNITKAQNIYYELLRTLDDKYEISANLSSLYQFIIDLLVQGNVKKDKAMLEQALEMSKEFVDVWSQAIQIYRKTHGHMPEDQVIL